MPDFAAERLPARPVFLTNIPEWRRRSGQAADFTSMAIGIATGWTCPFVVRSQFTAKKLYCLNGSTNAGYVQMGLAAGIVAQGGFRWPNAYGSLSSIVLQAGVNSWQAFDIIDTIVTPGLWFVGWGASDTTATVQRLQVPSLGNELVGAFFAPSIMPLSGAFSFPHPRYTAPVPILAIGGVA